jgi:hypothetical protein
VSKHGPYRQLQREAREKTESDKALLLEYSVWLQKLLWLNEDVSTAKSEWLIDLFQKERAK